MNYDHRESKSRERMKKEEDNLARKTVLDDLDKSLLLFFTMRYEDGRRNHFCDLRTRVKVIVCRVMREATDDAMKDLIELYNEADR